MSDDKPKKKRRLTLKQKVLVKEAAKTLNKSEAARRAGYKLTKSGADAFRQPHVQEAFQAELDKRDLNSAVADITARLIQEAREGKMSHRDQMALIEKFVKISGQEPARRQEILKASGKPSDFKKLLPKFEESDD